MCTYLWHDNGDMRPSFWFSGYVHLSYPLLLKSEHFHMDRPLFARPSVKPCSLIAKDLNLWSTLVFVRFEKLNFSDFWGPLNLLGPSKKSQLLDSWPLSMPLKTRPWMNLFKFFVLYLLHNPSELYSPIHPRHAHYIITLHNL